MTELRGPHQADADRPSSPLAEVAAAAGIRRALLVAWRDLEDPEAGGSEVHAARVAERWAAAGIDVTVRTSRAAGAPAQAERDGYHVVRRGGRYQVFPTVAAEGLRLPRDPSLGVVEVWNGMPFFSPLWARHPRAVFLHHVHGAMWDMVLPPALARAGRLLERWVAPPAYRGTPVVTLSESSRRVILSRLRLPPGQVTVAGSPGVDPRFSPGGRQAGQPLVAAVGRLVPPKQYPALVEVLARVKRQVPALEAVIAGEGLRGPQVEAAVDRHGARSWLSLPGHLGDDEVLALYRRAWVVASASSHEGWGLTITEAAACATPAVATAIAGHQDSVLDGETGLLAATPSGLEQALHRVLTDRVLRRRLGEAARARATQLTWDATALHALAALASDARRSLARATASPRGMTTRR